MKLPKVHPFLQFVYGIVAFIAIVITILLSGCDSEKRAVRQAAKIQAKYPHVMASACGLYYPPGDSTHIETKYIKGDPIVSKVTNTVYVNCDSAVAAAKKIGSKANNVGAPCPPCDSLRIDTVYIDRYVQQVNRAKETDLEHRLNVANDKIAAQGVTIHWWMWIALLFGVYSILRWVLRIWNIKLP